ncbi:MAG: 3-dehydroquinate synthase [Bacteroidales bacterium]|nr:3-dehydroquinate synthase [Bacteroidales bacterium]
MSKENRTLYGGLAALGRELAKEAWADARYTIVVDENTFNCCLPTLIGRIEVLQEAEFIEVPVGEECKSLEVAAQVWQTLLEGGADRQTVIVNLGGGAVCDLGGFVAAGYKRGIRHINIPTTLLAMTDAAIGGKTGIDFGGVKNSIGHFYPAALTVIEPRFLDTLPEAELLNGTVEMVKTAAVADPELYMRLLEAPTVRPTGRQDIVAVGRIKNRVVKADPYDHGIRKILNFGHTFGHAIEVYRQLPHGIAVGIGMRVAMYLSVKKLGLGEEVYRTYSQWLRQQLSTFNFQLSTFNLKDIEQMLPLMHQDKKNADGELRCVLLQEPGAAVIDVTVSDNEVRDAFLHLK